VVHSCCCDGGSGGCASSPSKKAEVSKPPEALSRLQDALKSARDAAAKEPNNAERQYQLGNALFDLQRYDEARVAYEATIAISPQYGSAHCNLGLCLRFLGLLPQAIEEYRKAIAIDPKDVTTRYNLIAALERRAISRAS